MKPLTLKEAEYIAHALAKQLLDFDEPVPPFATRYPGRLESCLGQPFVTYDGKELYPEWSDKVSLLFYLVIKNHPFENGNKRMAVTIMTVFLYLNDKWLDVLPQDLYDVACEIAESPPAMKNEVIAMISNFLKKNVKPLSVFRS